MEIVTRQQRRKLERQALKVPKQSDRRTKHAKQVGTIAPAASTASRKKLGPYLVPLHIYGPEVRAMEPSERDIAALHYSHWISMMQRNPSGFRRDCGSAKRKRSRNPRPSPLAMFLNGLKLVARHGNAAPGSAFS